LILVIPRNWTLLSVVGGSLIVTVAVEVPSVAPPVGDDRVTVKVSGTSVTPSEMIGIMKVCGVLLPFANDTVPDVEVKSVPDVAVPLDVAY
jgi:hypothetical protein